jgi:large-conductance mechanosensitive channel
MKKLVVDMAAAFVISLAYVEIVGLIVRNYIY